LKLAIATDAWLPQVNGVVVSLCSTVEELNRRGCHPELITPDQFVTMPMPGYASIRLAMAPRFGLRRKLARFKPDIVHIPTEGPIGWAARNWCLEHDVPFTSAFHTRFPEYASVRTGLNEEHFWPIIRRFHAPSQAILVATGSLERELRGRGFGPLHHWSRGIDRSIFRPEGAQHAETDGMPGPVLLYVGRVAPEKNLQAFLDAPVRGTKVIVGDGPALSGLRQAYPDAKFLGALFGEELACAYRAADCFVFPSLTDTFGVVIIEALACGLPVAAYPVTGPIDILGPDGFGADRQLQTPAGSLDHDLGKAIENALCANREAAAELGSQYSWESATDQFLSALETALAASRGETSSRAA